MNELRDIDQLGLNSRHWLPYQSEAIMETARLVIWEKSIRIGATYCLAFRAVRRRMIGLGNYLHSSVNERIAKSFAEECKRFCQIYKIAASEVYEFSLYNPLLDMQESAFEMKFPNGFFIKVFSSNPDALRGEGGEVGVDEITSHKQPGEMLKAAGGRAMWGYPITIWSSHKGEDSAFNEWIKQERAKGARSEWKIRTTDLFQALDVGLLDKINAVRKAECDAAGIAFEPILREKFIAQTKAMVGGEEAFEEECLCKPRKGGQSAVKWVYIDAAREDYELARVDMTSSDTSYEMVINALADTQRNTRMALGYDVARTGHLSSIWCNVMQPDDRWRLNGLITMRNVPFNVQRDCVRALMQRFPQMIGGGDSTGLGMDTCETLTNEFTENRFIGMNFSSLKPAIGTKLTSVFEDRRQVIPAGARHDDIAYDIAAIRTASLPSGRASFYESPNPLNKNSHADIAWSDGLALMAADEVDNQCGYYSRGNRGN